MLDYIGILCHYHPGGTPRSERCVLSPDGSPTSPNARNRTIGLRNRCRIAQCANELSGKRSSGASSNLPSGRPMRCSTGITCESKRRLLLLAKLHLIGAADNAIDAAFWVALTALPGAAGGRKAGTARRIDLGVVAHRKSWRNRGHAENIAPHFAASRRSREARSPGSINATTCCAQRTC